MENASDNQSSNSVQDVFSSVKSFFQQAADIPLIEMAKLLPHLRIKRIRKDEYVFRQGEFTTEVFLIVNGLAYVFYEDEQGREKVKRFLVEKQVCTPYVSIIENKPAQYAAKTIVDTTFVSVPYPTVERIFNEHPSWLKFLTRQLQYQIVEREKKEYELFMMDAEARYNSFVERHREILDKIPQYLIASYIGITPVALSRIRSRNSRGS